MFTRDVKMVANSNHMEWLRVPMMPTVEMLDRAWTNILARHREANGDAMVTDALALLRKYDIKVPKADK